MQVLIREHRMDVPHYSLVRRKFLFDKFVNKVFILFQASAFGHLDVVELLLKSGAEIHHKDNEGCSALYIAAQEGHKDVVEILIKHKADINDTEIGGLTALSIVI